jgi:hypothetical protein
MLDTQPLVPTIFKITISHTSYIFARNALCYSLFSAMYEDFNPTLFAIFGRFFVTFECEANKLSVYHALFIWHFTLSKPPSRGEQKENSDIDSFSIIFCLR